MNAQSIIHDVTTDGVLELSVSQAFNRWRSARERLHAIERRFNEKKEEPSIVLPQEVIDPRSLSDFQRYVVNTYHELFQRTILAFRDMVTLCNHVPAFHVFAKWDINETEPLSQFADGNIYNVRFVFDMLVAVPGFGKCQCVVMVLEEGKTFYRFPIPVDFVEKIEGIEERHVLPVRNK